MSEFAEWSPAKPSMISEAGTVASPVFHTGDRVTPISDGIDHRDEPGFVAEILGPMGDLPQRYRVLFSDGRWSTFFEFELEPIDARLMRSARKQQPECKLQANSLFKNGNAGIEVHHNADHSIFIAHVWIWPEEKGRLAHHTVEALSGNLINLSPNVKKRLDVTRPLLKAIGRANAVGARIWMAFHVDPSPAGSLPPVASFEVDIHESAVTRFDLWRSVAPGSS